MILRETYKCERDGYGKEVDEIFNSLSVTFLTLMRDWLKMEKMGREETRERISP